MAVTSSRHAGRVALLVLLLAACSVAPSTAPSPAASESPTPAPASLSPTARPTVAPSPSPTPTPSLSPPFAPPPSATAPGSVLHTVAAGESLSLVAVRYATTWQGIVCWNRERYDGLDPASAGYDPNRIAIGWQLIVWPGVVVPFDAPLPTAAPTPTPRPTTPPPTTPPPTTPPPTTPAPTAASSLVTNGSRTSGAVALTFDMGGRTDPAVSIVTWLRDHGVPATIFITGASVDGSDAARDVIDLVNANASLFDLGNHSYRHPDMTTMTAAEVSAEVTRAERAIAAYATQPTRPLFRPPYGAWDEEMLAGVGAAGYRWSVMWDVDTVDWKPVSDGGPTAEQIVAKVVSRATEGSIVLMHLGGYETLDALPDIVSGLEGRGLRLVTLESLLGG